MALENVFTFINANNRTLPCQNVALFLTRTAYWYGTIPQQTRFITNDAPCHSQL